ncbi:MAG: SPFH domain-containing protein [Dactylosporangium sp.]|nr:SPFH domain-containing protein [Dactylosporangium sp.]NNJ63083.1 SPFH domain-containing protein [Dactylosporangium sp.]
MPALFICAIVLFAIAILAALYRLVSPPETQNLALGGAAGAALLGCILTLASSANSVPVRNVGIVTSFNKPTGQTTGSGLNWVAPWKRIGEWDASRQKYDHIGEDKAVTVRTATLANAGIELLVEWQVSPDDAPRQFMDYKGDFEAFRGQRVGVQLDGAVNDAFATYDPLSNIDTKTGNLNVDLKPFADKVRTSAQERLDDDIEILSVTIIRVNHDEKTEANIKLFQDKLAQSRNLDQDLINAEKQIAVTRKNAEADKVTRCLEIAERTGNSPGLCLNSGFVMGSK